MTAASQRIVYSLTERTVCQLDVEKKLITTNGNRSQEQRLATEIKRAVTPRFDVFGGLQIQHTNTADADVIISGGRLGSRVLISETTSAEVNAGASQVAEEDRKRISSDVNTRTVTAWNDARLNLSAGRGLVRRTFSSDLIQRDSAGASYEREFEPDFTASSGISIARERDYLETSRDNAESRYSSFNLQFSWRFGRSVQPAAPRRQYEVTLAVNSDHSRTNSAREQQETIEGRLAANF